MSDLQHLQQRLEEAAGPDERFGITIGQRFLRGSMGQNLGKAPDIIIMHWRFQNLHEVGTGRCVAYGSSIDAAMAGFECWLKQREEVQVA